MKVAAAVSRQAVVDAIGGAVVRSVKVGWPVKAVDAGCGSEEVTSGSRTQR